MNDDRPDPTTIAMSSDIGHRRLPRTLLPKLEATSRTDPLHGSSFTATEGDDTREGHRKKKKKKQKKVDEQKDEHEQLNEQSEPQDVNDLTEVSKF